MNRFIASRRMVVIATAAVVATTIPAAIVEARPGPDRERVRVRRVERHRPVQHRSMDALEHLDLKEEQRDKLRQIRRSGLEVMAQKRVAMAQARMDLHDLMEKDASTSDLRNAHAKLAKARADLQAAAFDLRMQARDVLTPEQRKELRKSPRKGMRRLGALLPQDALPPPDEPWSQPGDDDFEMVLDDEDWQED